MEKASAAKIESLVAIIQLRSPAILSSQKALAFRVLMPLESNGWITTKRFPKNV